MFNLHPGTCARAIFGLPNCYYSMLFSKIIFLLFLICLIYCALSVFYLFILSLAARLFFSKRMDLLADDVLKRKIAVLVPAYREDGIILSTANNLLALDY